MRALALATIRPASTLREIQEIPQSVRCHRRSVDAASARTKLAQLLLGTRSTRHPIGINYVVSQKHNLNLNSQFGRSVGFQVCLSAEEEGMYVAVFRSTSSKSPPGRVCDCLKEQPDVTHSIGAACALNGLPSLVKLARSLRPAAVGQYDTLINYGVSTTH